VDRIKSRADDTTKRVCEISRVGGVRLTDEGGDRANPRGSARGLRERGERMKSHCHKCTEKRERQKGIRVGSEKEMNSQERRERGRELG
jgi:hypothetical protein